MCGISGIVDFTNRSVNKDELKKMNSFLNERGPDNEGFWYSSHIGFGHTRLSIVDLSPLGHQPMQDVNKQCVITFNGEIYNYETLRVELTKGGAQFKNHSDTEVLLEGFLQWGIDKLLNKIDGMFAFVLYHEKSNTIYACRDRFGQKPLYFFHGSDTFKFSSDIRSISFTESELTLDLESVDYYLTELSSPQPKTVWREISQVQPAHYLKIGLRDSTVQSNRYWSMDYTTKLRIDIHEAEELVEAELMKAVTRRIHGDVPMGTFLSGGIDSGLVTALLAQNSKERINTFTVGFSHSAYDESTEARQLAERYDTDHHEILLEPNNIASTLTSILEYIGEPFSDPSIIPSHYISSEISSYVKVALSGDGGDELFGGYHEYITAFHADKLVEKSALSKHFSIVTSKLIHKANSSKINLGNAHSFTGKSGAEKLYRGMGINFDSKIDLYNPNVFHQTNDFAINKLDSIWNQYAQPKLLDTLFRSSLDTRLLNNYLVKLDRTSMFSSLEARNPFLDHHLAQTAFQIPSEFHLHNGCSKYLLKSLAKKHLDENIFRRKKQGFGIPLEFWLYNEMKGFVLDVLAGENKFIDDLIKPKFRKALIDSFQKRQSGNERTIWGLMCLEFWGQNSQKC